MTAKKKSAPPSAATKVPLVLRRAEGLDRASFAADAADAVIKLVNEARERQGLPPLADDDPKGDA